MCCHNGKNTNIVDIRLDSIVHRCTLHTLCCHTGINKDIVDITIDEIIHSFQPNWLYQGVLVTLS